MIIVEFTAEEMKFFAETGAKRTNENKHKPNIADYNEKYMKGLSGLQSDKLGVAAEAAVVKLLGYDPLSVGREVWPSFYTDSEAASFKHSPDVFHDNKVYEVRRVNKRSNPLCIRSKDVENNAIVIKVFIPHYFDEEGRLKVARYAEVLCWSDSAEDWEDASKPFWARTDNARVTEGRSIEDMKYNKRGMVKTND